MLLLHCSSHWYNAPTFVRPTISSISLEWPSFLFSDFTHYIHCLIHRNKKNMNSRDIVTVIVLVFPYDST